MSSRIPRVLAVVAVAVAIVFAVRYATRTRPVPVVLARVEHGVVEESVANTRAGTIKACRRARLAPSTGGTITGLPFHVGDRVKAGALLLEIWNRDVAAQRELAASAVRAAQARAEEACLVADQGAREAARLSRLAKEGIVGAQSTEQATAQADAQASACRAARAALGEAQAQLGVARAAVERTELRAPFDGVIAELSAELGEMVIPSPPGIPTPPAVDLIELGCLYVTAPFDEVDAPRITTGLPARVTLDALPGRSFKGHVRRVAPYVLDREKQSRTVEVEVEIEDVSALAELKPGYSADIEVVLAVHRDVPRIPSEAVQENGRVLVLDGDGRLAARPIVAGASNWQFTEVKSGLSDGERVVLSLDREGVRAGAPAVEDAHAPKDAAAARSR